MRLIDVEALKPKAITVEKLDGNGCPYEFLAVPLITIENASTQEAKPVVNASWVEVSGGRIICDHCGNYPLYDYFGRINLSRCCPICGALMSNGGHWLFRKAEEYLKENNCGAQIDEEFASDNNVGSKGVKIPVISMEDLPKIMEEIK